MSAQDVPKAEEILGQILKAFTDAKETSDKFKARLDRDDPILQAHDAQQDLDPIGASLHQMMHNLSVKRKNGASLQRKVRWALYDDRHFHEFIDIITKLIDGLVGLSPAVQEDQRRLCMHEVSEFGEIFGILRDIAKGRDRFPDSALAEALKSIVSSCLSGYFFYS